MWGELPDEGKTRWSRVRQPTRHPLSCSMITALVVPEQSVRTMSPLGIVAGWGPAPGRKPGLGTCWLCRLVTGARAQARAGNVWAPPPFCPTPRTRTPPVGRSGHIRVSPPPSRPWVRTVSMPEQGLSALLKSQLPVSQSVSTGSLTSRQDSSGWVSVRILLMPCLPCMRLPGEGFSRVHTPP